MKTKILETPRLILDTIEEKDFPDLFCLLSNPQVQRFQSKTHNAEESRYYFGKIQEKYRDEGTSFWAVNRKDIEKFIGICGINRRVIEEKEEFEVGFGILNVYWGHGFGSEAALGCIRYAREVLGKGSVISLIQEMNYQSMRVAEKNGMVFEKMTLFDNHPHLLYRIKF